MAAANDRSRFGQVEFASSDDDGLDNGLEAQLSPRRALLRAEGKHVWRPPGDLRDEFVEPLSIPIEVYRTLDGTRVFVPVTSLERFISDAFDAGFSLLSRDKQFSWEHRSTYIAMRLIFTCVRRMKEQFRRNFACFNDLNVRLRGRESYDEHSVLPDDLGLNEHRRGTSWSIAELLRRGRQRSHKEGAEWPDERTAIQYGLLAAAEQNPLFLHKQAEVDSLIRITLFAPADCDKKLTESEIGTVYERLTGLMERHASDSRQAIQRWLCGPSSNLPKAIAGRKMERGTVRKALLHLGWQAHRYVGDCIGYFLQNFVRGIPEPLSSVERERVEHMYMPQPYLGGLCLPLLYRRNDCFAPIIGRLWQSPGNQAVVAVLYRMLWSYVAMAHQRREADRRSKRHGVHLEIAVSDPFDAQACEQGNCLRSYRND